MSAAQVPLPGAGVPEVPQSPSDWPAPTLDGLALDGPLSDVELLRRARAGDGDAWDLLVRRYQGLVFSVALRCGLDRADAADVAQATFIAFLEASTRLRDDERLAAWLVTVARRKAWRVRRRSSRELPTATLPSPVEEPPLEWEQITTLHSALQQMANPCRDLLIALYLDPQEPTYAEIAVRFHRSIGSIGPMRGRCLARLKILLDDGAE